MKMNNIFITDIHIAMPDQIGNLLNTLSSLLSSQYQMFQRKMQETNSGQRQNNVSFNISSLAPQLFQWMFYVPKPDVEGPFIILFLHFARFDMT